MHIFRCVLHCTALRAALHCVTEIKITVNKDHYEHIAIRTSNMFLWAIKNNNQHSTNLTKQRVQASAVKAPSRKPAVCCCVVVAAAYTNRGGRPSLPDWGFK